MSKQEDGYWLLTIDGGFPKAIYLGEFKDVEGGKCAIDRAQDYVDAKDAPSGMVIDYYHMKLLLPVMEDTVAEEGIPWDNDKIQFARLIIELDGVGVFTVLVMNQLKSSMDLDRTGLIELINRAQTAFEKAKPPIPT